MTRTSRKTRGLLYGGLGLYALISLVPPVWMFVSSLKTSATIFEFPPRLSEGWTLQNYINVYLQGSYPTFILNSAIIVLATVVLTVVIGATAGYALSRFELPGREDMQFFALTTRMGPPVAFALPFYVLFSRFNLVDTKVGMVAVYILFNLAFAIWMMKGFIDEVPEKYEEAAQLDGYSRLAVLRKVVFPLVKPGLAATAIFVFIFTWNEFFYGLILTNNVAKPYTVQLTAFQGPNQLLWGQLFAATIIPIIPPLVFAVLMRKKLARGLTFGALSS
jgi:multiple sugar transport system permease protein